MLGYALLFVCVKPPNEIETYQFFFFSIYTNRTPRTLYRRWVRKSRRQPGQPEVLRSLNNTAAYSLFVRRCSVSSPLSLPRVGRVFLISFLFEYIFCYFSVFFYFVYIYFIFCLLRLRVIPGHLFVTANCWIGVDEQILFVIVATSRRPTQYPYITLPPPIVQHSTAADLCVQMCKLTRLHKINMFYQ